MIAARVALGVCAMDLVGLAVLAVGGGRREANLHPYVRSGGQDRYLPDGGRFLPPVVGTSTAGPSRAPAVGDHASSALTEKGDRC